MGQEELKKNYLGEIEPAVKNFKTSYDTLITKFQVSNTPKIHTINDHYVDYVKMTGRPLGLTNDQIIETTHQYVNHTMVSSNYTIRDLESEIHGEKLLRLVLHQNSYNILE